jgi:hypothetical protein
MKLSTSVTIPKSDITVAHEHPVLLIGSCFAQNIGEKLQQNKFNVTLNPNGIIYNPISIVIALKRIIKNESYTASELHQTNNKWVSFNHHGSFSAFDREECLEQINTSLSETHEQLKLTKTIFITFGSAWVYEYADAGIVANCHKIPNKEFNKKLLSLKEILSAFNELQVSLKYINVVFTVSPVRHTKDGLHENNLSKATLLLAINNLIKQNDNYHYFPAYELVIDELRDYRFYKDDLVHPSDLAINYVWEKFGEVYFDEDTKTLNEAIQKVQQAAHHKPFDFSSEAHQKFIKAMLETMDRINEDFPFLDFKEEKAVLKFS